MDEFADNSNHSQREEGRVACRTMPVWAKFYLNILMHVSLLMMILTALFFTVIMPAEQDALKSEIKSGLSTFLTPYIQNGTTVGNIIHKIPMDMLNKSLVAFDTPNFYVTDNNNRLMTQAATMCVILALMFIGSYIALRFSCGFCSEILYLIMENLCTFLFVGIVEYLFFTRVALHYVPTLPSFFVTSILDEAKTILVALKQ